MPISADMTSACCEIEDHLEEAYASNHLHPLLDVATFPELLVMLSDELYHQSVYSPYKTGLAPLQATKEAYSTRDDAWLESIALTLTDPSGNSTIGLELHKLWDDLQRLQLSLRLVLTEAFATAKMVYEPALHYPAHEACSDATGFGREDATDLNVYLRTMLRIVDDVSEQYPNASILAYCQSLHDRTLAAPSPASASDMSHTIPSWPSIKHISRLDVSYWVRQLIHPKVTAGFYAWDMSDAEACYYTRHFDRYFALYRETWSRICSIWVRNLCTRLQAKLPLEVRERVWSYVVPSSPAIITTESFFGRDHPSGDVHLDPSLASPTFAIQIQRGWTFSSDEVKDMTWRTSLNSRLGDACFMEYCQAWYRNRSFTVDDQLVSCLLTRNVWGLEFLPHRYLRNVNVLFKVDHPNLLSSLTARARDLIGLNKIKARNARLQITIGITFPSKFCFSHLWVHEDHQRDKSVTIIREIITVLQSAWQGGDMKHLSIELEWSDGPSFWFMTPISGLRDTFSGWCTRMDRVDPVGGDIKIKI
ncbi:hypothetical protein AG0111_0g13156 [Alternaria gaisen]|uniref:Uncharacterized protein n=1 Tax=Alternaria gaisen TaxID=167740 RepID=A0ACB6F2K1_9PLEO|nr:hypothetical protein AG0111_0g13156 [Alternaria gaisen]